MDYIKKIELAKKIAEKGGKLINKLSSEDIEVRSKGTHDFVTNVDTSVEDLIIKELKAEFPNHGILAEESGIGESDSEYKWIIDPIDGTTNFTRGIPIYAISIGLEHKGETVGGVVYNVAIDEMFTAVKGEGAYLNGKRIHVSEQSKIEDTLIGTGFPFKRGVGYDQYMGLFKQIAIKTAGIRRPGSASIDLCWVACGRYDAFFEFGLNPWDVGAGVVIIKEAGGVVTDTKGGNDYVYGKSIIGANNKIIHSFLLEQITEYYYKS